MTTLFPDFHQTALDLLRKHEIAIESLTADQLATALLQAIQCGDFQRNVVVESPRTLDQPLKLEITHTQSVTYLPFRREQELLDRIKELEE